jgi:type IV pilus assembly protein PilC
MIYIYRAKKGPKEIMRGEIEASSQDDAVTKLENMNLTPVSVTPKYTAKSRAAPRQPAGVPHADVPSAGVPPPAGPPTQRSAGLTPARVKPPDIDTFTRQLASLIRSGVPVVGSLSLISQQAENKALKKLAGELEANVKDGKMLSEAMEEREGLFNNLYISLVKAGEKGGVLDETLQRLALHREREAEIRRKIQAALAYPILLITVGIATVFIMLTYFLPRLAGLFENMRQALPLPTKILIGVSNFTSGNWYWILAGLFVLAAVFGRVKSGSKKKIIFDVIKLRVPFIKKFIMDAEIAKFTKTLALLLESGVPVHESLNLATETLDNDALKGSLIQVERDIITDGATLSGSLRKIDIFPKFATNMIAVGEEGGRLEQSLGEIAAIYEREVEQAIKITSALLEPLLILTVGVIVGFIVFAMLLPIFNIGIMGG